MASDPQARMTYDSLFKTNHPPSDAQRVEIAASLRVLEAEYKNLSDDDPGPYESLPIESDEHDPGYQVPSSRTPEVLAAIHRHRALLSCVRDIPPEIWQKVYAIILLEHSEAGWKLSRHSALQTLCSVSRQWRDAATTQKSFWTVFPPTVARGNAGQIPRHECLDLYLERSEPLPFSFTYASRGYFLQANRQVFPQPGAPVHPFPQNLLRASTRWNRITVCLLLPEIQNLLCIQGHIPNLKAVKLAFGISEAVQGTMPQINGLFSTAPSLRHFAVETVCIPHEIVAPVFELPWSQIKFFISSSRREPYFYSLVCHQATLTRLHIDSLEFPPQRRSDIPAGQGILFTLSHLTHFSLRVTPGWGYMYLILDILMRLRAPALEELRIFGAGHRNTIVVVVQATLVAILSTSMSKLKRLTLDGKSALIGPTIMHLLPHLEKLDIGTPELNDFEHYCTMLSAHAPAPPNGVVQLTGSCSTTLPRLSSLLLRTVYSCSDHPATLPSTRPREDVTPSEPEWAAAMKTLIALRTYAIPEEIATVVVPLREIHFIDCNKSDGFLKDWLEQLYSLYDALELSRLPSGITRISPNIVEELRDGLTKMWLWSEASSIPRKDLAGSTAHWDQQAIMDTLIRKIEVLDLSTLDSRPLAMRGIFFFLSDLAASEDGAILQDDLYNLQKRVRTLYDKWTPFLSRDMQWSPFRWCYVNQYHLRLKYAGLEAPSTIQELIESPAVDD
ncbi:hypothetical protein DFP72DRAFT_1177578 [Ephemerocybe angulata]|uniref:F-box domain-containing protein n=1 Tax=Ephemerocybe angulata TaxID=980116 RepID=A0A8H6HBD7_9AGAR|nr:hypothetical protein DFP72DRAFT_1177578 [Tulosesus angulatus]